MTVVLVTSSLALLMRKKVHRPIEGHDSGESRGFDEERFIDRLDLNERGMGNLGRKRIEGIEWGR